MKQYCPESFIYEYHEYVMKYAQETMQCKDKQNDEKMQRKKKMDDVHIFVPRFDVEAILDEKQDSDGDDIQFKIRWKGWPKEYDSWTYQEYLDEYTLEMVDKFRRHKRCNLGQKGFGSQYWKELYATEWEEFMDGHSNGMDHAEYVYAFFKKYDMQQSIQHIADFGFGHGSLLDAFVKKFRAKVCRYYIYIDVCCNVYDCFYIDCIRSGTE